MFLGFLELHSTQQTFGRMSFVVCSSWHAPADYKLSASQIQKLRRAAGALYNDTKHQILVLGPPMA